MTANASHTVLATCLIVVAMASIFFLGMLSISDVDEHPTRCASVFALMHTSADSLGLVAAEPYCARYVHPKPVPR